MAVPTSPLPVCRFAGLLAGSEEQLVAARFELTQWYGTIDDASEIFPFTFTQYYDDEMGKNLLRQWVRFKALFSPEHIAKCKLETNMAETLLARQFHEIEAGQTHIAPGLPGVTPRIQGHAPNAPREPSIQKSFPLALEGKDIGGTPMPRITRPINIDPGYVHRYKVILATTKDHSHRVYLTEGIFAEVTLHWSQNRWTPWPWTYADYQSEIAQNFFTKARTDYLNQLQRIAGGHQRE